MFVGKNENKYLFTSSRLGFRTWTSNDIEEMCLLNSDIDVMKFFPSLPSKKQTLDFISRMQDQFSEKGFCYFPVDDLKTNRFIGFIGLSTQNFKSNFTPCVDIGWRLKKEYWGKGLATEGAKECLEFAKNNLKLQSIYAMASKINLRSVMVMEKIGMSHIKDFDHPKLINTPELKKCVLYKIDL